jgi:hypothetical protein
MNLPDTYRGKPILIIGGGPTVNEALELVPADYPACVISANENGFKQGKFKVDFIAFSDEMHARLRMHTNRAWDRFYPGVPTVSKHPWSTYQLDRDKVFGTNAGFVALDVAAALGGDPIVVSGVDCTNGTRPYFWQETSRDVFFRPGIRARCKVWAERHTHLNFLRMPSMTAWSMWEVFDENRLHVVRG